LHRLIPWTLFVQSNLSIPFAQSRRLGLLNQSILFAQFDQFCP
jgi:hypothetical protein